MPTTVGNALSALRAQRDALLAEDPVDAGKLRMVRRLIRSLRSGGDATEEADDIREAFRAIRDTEADPTLFVESEWREDAVLLMQRLSSMPVDDQDPAYVADNSLIRQDQVEREIRQTALNADPAFDPVRDACFDWLERFFDVYRDERPVETQFTADLSALNGGALDGATLATTLSSLESNAGRLKRPDSA